MLLLCLLPGLHLFSAGKDSLLAAGPMVGHMDIVEAHLWVQTTSPAAVHLRYWPQADKSKAQNTPKQTTGGADYFIAKFFITDLQPATTYTYELYINKKQVKRPYPTTFTTQTFWQYRSEPPTVRFALGSCIYINDPDFNRPGKDYGGEFQTLDRIRTQEPDFMLWLGDNVYLRETDFFTKARLAYRYRHTRGFDGLQALLASCANYAIWDDHDYGPNDSNRSYPFKDVTADLFKHYWSNPHYGMPDTPGIFGFMQWADLDFFMLDNRYHRAPEKLQDPARDYLGRGQMRWLKDALLTSKAPFKFIVNGSQSINRYNQYESFTNYAGEHTELMDFIRTHEIEGVVFLSGDRHITELLKVERPNAYPFYEFTSSPLTSGMSGARGIEENNPLRVPGTLVQDKRNFGIIEVSGPSDDRVLTIKTIDSEGSERWTHTIKSSELK